MKMQSDNLNPIFDGLAIAVGQYVGNGPINRAPYEARGIRPLPAQGALSVQLDQLQESSTSLPPLQQQLQGQQGPCAYAERPNRWSSQAEGVLSLFSGSSCNRTAGDAAARGRREDGACGHRPDIWPAAIGEQIETWKDVYEIEERYRGKLLGGDAKAWLEEVLIERNWHNETAGAEGRSPNAHLRDVERHTRRSPFANANFLKHGFLQACKSAGLFDAVQKCAAEKPAAH
jgi:hypothetical protein